MGCLNKSHPHTVQDPCRRGGRKAEVVDDFREAAFSSHSGTDVHYEFTETVAACTRPAQSPSTEKEGKWALSPILAKKLFSVGGSWKRKISFSSGVALRISATRLGKLMLRSGWQQETPCVFLVLFVCAYFL